MSVNVESPSQCLTALPCLAFGSAVRWVSSSTRSAMDERHRRSSPCATGKQRPSGRGNKKSSENKSFIRKCDFSQEGIIDHEEETKIRKSLSRHREDTLKGTSLLRITLDTTQPTVLCVIGCKSLHLFLMAYSCLHAVFCINLSSKSAPVPAGRRPPDRRG